MDYSIFSLVTNEVLVATLSITPILTAFGQAIKIGGFPTKYFPFLMAVIGGVVISSIGGWTFIPAVLGVASGLSASGLYELGKQTAKSFNS